MIHVLKCPECHAPVAPDYKQCKYCKSYLVIDRPEQFPSSDKQDDDVEKKDGRKQYLSYFNEALARNPQDFNAIFGLGLWYFNAGLYKEARGQFEQARKLRPTHAEIYYYHALTFLNGKRPRVQRLAEIEELEKFLEVASKIDPSNAIFDYFKAIVKYDYYEGNGLKVNPPSVKDLLKEAKKKTLKEGERDKLFAYLKIKDEILKDSILQKTNLKEKKKRREIRVYYIRYYIWAYLFILIGIILPRVHIPLEFPALILASIFIIPGIALLSWYFYNMPSPKTMSRYLDEDIERLRTVLAWEELGIDDSILVRESEIVFGPANPESQKNSKEKKDVRLYKKIRAEVVLFGRDQLMCYSCVFDSTKGKASEESTYEYFYKDVVSVSTEHRTEPITINGKKSALKQAEVFALTTSGGTAIELVIDDGKSKQMDYRPVTMATQAVTSIRRMLRDKKSSKAS